MVNSDMSYFPLEIIDSNIDYNKYVYHYTSLKTALECILCKGTLRFSPFINVNDPKESKWHQFTFLMSSKDEELLYKKGDRNYGSIADRILGCNSKVICFSCDNSEINHVNSQIKNFYLGSCKPRMWAQYGENYRGVCLKFNKKVLDKYIHDNLNKSGVLFRGKVKYSIKFKNYSEALKINFSDVVKYGIENYLINLHLSKYRREFFFTKSSDWKNECEYRWVYIGNNDDYVEIPFGNSLEGIYIGSDFPETYLPCIKALNRNYKVGLKKVNWLNGYPMVFQFENSY